jgi:phosphoglycolate phosphatase
MSPLKAIIFDLDGTLVDRFLTIYEANVSRHTEANPGVADTLAGLQRLGLPLAVVTNKPVVAAVDILEAFKLHAYFAAVIGGDTLPERKPRAAPIL